MAQPKPRVVAFDCGGVLLDECPTGMYKWLAKKYPEKADKLVKAHHRNYDAWNRLKLEPEFSEADYWTVVIQNEGLTETVEDMKRYLRESLRHFPEVLKVAGEVKSSGTLVGIVSNHATEWFEDIADRFGFYDVFPRDYTIVSQTVRAAKPDAKILDILMERITRDHGQIHRHEVVFVDDKAANVEAAKQYGFHGIQFDALVTPADQLRAQFEKLGLL
eukprot:TRINITY_DN1189_c0_g1_i3.p2 TRINITY_DN1189_c0_g1~~TRINITY_DN1189_c0_g1_i3.p2  ORF type:complete len:231 (+),score=42.39 TRINITY_DN1189_c0_g1_i3:40-693(+)